MGLWNTTIGKTEIGKTTAGKTKLAIALVVVVLLGLFLPPNINGTRFRDRLAPALSAALGREVRIGQVKYRLLPRPGFDLYQFEVICCPGQALISTSLR
jgi:uncharacterized protein involved in outer membrane biogenesis